MFLQWQRDTVRRLRKSAINRTLASPPNVGLTAAVPYVGFETKSGSAKTAHDWLREWRTKCLCHLEKQTPTLPLF